MGPLYVAGRPVSPAVRGQRLAAAAAHGTRAHWPLKGGARRGAASLASLARQPTHRCLRGNRERTTHDRKDLWRASALQNAFSGASAHDDSAARRCRRQLYMCVRRQLRNINYEVRFTRSGSFLICAEIRTKLKGAGLGVVSPRETGRRSRFSSRASWLSARPLMRWTANCYMSVVVPFE